MEEFIYKYYIDPIWDKTGYNAINTITYAIFAILALFFLYRYLKGKIVWNTQTILNIIPFVLIGSTYRVITDAIDAGKFLPITPIHRWILDSHIFDYGYFTVTPGIYLAVASILILTIIILDKIKKMELLGKIGLVLWAPGILLLLPLMSFVIYAIPVFLMAGGVYLVGSKIIKLDFLRSFVGFSQALDGAATFFAIEVFSKITGITYFEQHVFSAGLGNFFGSFFVFFLIKATLGLGAGYLIQKEEGKEEDKNFITLILIIMGLAPGIRDILRMMIGT
jgi:uncharacterized membrane protein